MAFIFILILLTIFIFLIVWGISDDEGENEIMIYDVKEQPPKIKVEEYFPKIEVKELIPLTCKCCGGAIDKETLTCKYCKIEYII